MSRFSIAVLGMSSCVLLSSAAAEENCQGVLVPDIALFKNDISVRSSYLMSMDEEQIESIAKQNDFGAVLNGYLGLNANSSKDQRMQARTKYLERSELSLRDASFYLFKSTTDGARRAYIECVAAKNGIALSMEPAGSELFAVTAHWAPPAGGGPLKVPGLVGGGDLKFVFTGGVRPASELPREIAINGDVTFHLKRNPDEAGVLTVSGAGKRDTLTFPRDPRVIACAGPAWKTQQMVLPVKIGAHISHYGDHIRNTAIYNADTRGFATTEESAGNPGNYSTNVESLGIWFDTSMNFPDYPDLGIEFICHVNQWGWASKPSNQPRYRDPVTITSAGQTKGAWCIDQETNRRVEAVKARLVGSDAKYFTLRYSCTYGGRASDGSEYTENSPCGTTGLALPLNSFSLSVESKGDCPPTIRR